MMMLHKDGSVTTTAKKYRSIINNHFTSIINNHLNASSDSDEDSEETSSLDIS